MRTLLSRRLTAGFARTAAVLAIPYLAFLLVSVAHQPFDYLWRAGWNLTQRSAPHGLDGSRIRIVDVDDTSLGRVGGRPWSPAVMAELVQQLHAAGAAVVGFDLKFESATGGSPHADQGFAQAIATTPVVIGFMMANSGGNGDVERKAEFAFPGSAAIQAMHRYPTAIVDPVPFQAAASGVGYANVAVDPDGIIRRVPLLAKLDERLVPSFGAEIVRIAQHATRYVITGDGYGLNSVRIGNLPVPTSVNAEIWLRYGPARPDLYIHAADVLADKFDHSLVASRIIVVGVSAPSLGDRWPTPFGNTIPGVEIVAQEIDQMLDGTLLSRPSWLRGAEILFTYLACLAIMGAAWFGRTPLVVATGILVLSMPVMDWLGAVYLRYVILWITPALAMILVALAMILIGRLTALPDRRNLGSAQAGGRP